MPVALVIGLIQTATAAFGDQGALGLTFDDEQHFAFGEAPALHLPVRGDSQAQPRDLSVFHETADSPGDRRGENRFHFHGRDDQQGFAFFHARALEHVTLFVRLKQLHEGALERGPNHAGRFFPRGLSQGAHLEAVITEFVFLVFDAQIRIAGFFIDPHAHDPRAETNQEIVFVVTRPGDFDFAVIASVQVYVKFMERNPDEFDREILAEGLHVKGGRHQ